MTKHAGRMRRRCPARRAEAIALNIQVLQQSQPLSPLPISHDAGTQALAAETFFVAAATSTDHATTGVSTNLDQADLAGWREVWS